MRRTGPALWGGGGALVLLFSHSGKSSFEGLPQPRVSNLLPDRASSGASGVKRRLFYGKFRVSLAINSLKNLRNVQLLIDN